MNTIELVLHVPSYEHEWLIGLLEDVATGFVQSDGELRAYVPAFRWRDQDRKRLDRRLASHGYEDVLDVHVLGESNWNAAWENSVTPVRIGPFLLGPTWAGVPPKHEDAVVLRIDPEQSFGTGHHPTTRLILQLLAEVVTKEDEVLDVGTGTGVLAIAACRLGATSAVGVDTNPDAVANARDNVAQNDVSPCVTVREGSVDVVSETEFDVVAANITRRVLLNDMSALVTRMAEDGALLLSGVLEGDSRRVHDCAKDHGLACDEEVVEDGWWAACFIDEGT